MAPIKDKWIRRFIIPETTRHKKGFTIYKITSMVFLNSSHEEVSKVSVWKRYNDFKKLHSELNNLHKQLEIKENLPTLPKSKYFGRFEAEVIEERRKYALKFLEFVGRHPYLYTSDIFITFFETSHIDNCTSDCAHSLSSDTSEEDRMVALNNSMLTDNTIAHSTFQVQCLSKTSRNVLANPCPTLSDITCTSEKESTISRKTNESYSICNVQNANIKKNEKDCYQMVREHVQDNLTEDCNMHVRSKNLDRDNIKKLSSKSGLDNMNNNINKNLSNCNTAHSTCPVMLHERDFSQTQSDFTQYILIAAAHMSAAFKHESIAEYEEAFTQYKLGISCLITGVQFDPDDTRAASIKDKISKYLAKAEHLYNIHLNCNISLVKKPVSELQYYKILKIMKSVMLAMDIRINCNRVIKTIERSSIRDNISNYILHKRVPYMVQLYACVETESTIFLILQHASCGKLWDFIKLHYKISESLHINTTSNHVCTNNHVNEEFNNNESIHKSNKLQKRDHSCSINRQNDIYNMEMPTMQLLEKSQKLLQSVNATLRRSNFIANRLNKSKDLKYSEDMSSLNAKIASQISQGLDLTLAGIYCDKSPDFSSIKVHDIIVSKNLPSKNNFIEKKDLKNTNTSFVSSNKDSHIIESTCVSIINRNCTIQNFLENKVNNLFDDSTSETTTSTHDTLINNIIQSHTTDDRNVSDETNSSNVDCINVNSSATLNKNCDDHKTQYFCSENISEEQELWQVPEAVIRSWAAEILLALEALHQQDILILDLKPDNILFDSTGHVQLTYIVPQFNTELSKLIYPYSSPESIMFSPTIHITSATDVWSFGVILYELLTGFMFAVKHPGSFHSHSTISIPNKLSENAKSLLYSILKYHPDERLTIDEIKRHSFFVEIDWSNMVNSET